MKLCFSCGPAWPANNLSYHIGTSKTAHQAVAWVGGVGYVTTTAN